MEKFETSTGEEAHVINGELATVFRLLSKPDAVKILYRAGLGIENSTYAIEELDLTPKKYYYRLKELMAADLVKKVDGVYRQTALGRIIYDRFLPAMGKTYDAKDELELIVYLEGTELDDGARKRIEDELNIPRFAESNNAKIIDNYESMVVDIIDICDESENNILLASNYVDVRVIEAVIRSHDRGVNFRLIMGEKASQSKLNQLRLMLSPRFAKAMIEFMSIPDDLGEMTRVTKLAYSFCIIDGFHCVYEVINPTDMEFLCASIIEDKRLAEKMICSFERLWETGKANEMLKFFNSLKKT